MKQPKSVFESLHEVSMGVLESEFVWKNTASVDNMPPEVRPVLDEIIEAVKDVYGKELNGALYLHGSSVAGGFRKGSSDVDGVWISDEPLDETHRDRRIARLGEILTNDSIGYLDIIAMPSSELGDMWRKSAVFSCGFNGVQVAGNRSYDLTPYLPKTRSDYFSCQYARFGFIIDLCREGYALDTLEQRSPRSLAKSLARAIFHARYAFGGRYEQQLPNMIEALREQGFEEDAEEVRQYLSYSTRTMSEAEKVEVFEKAGKLVQFFDGIVASNNSQYGQRVREWLKDIAQKT